MKKAKDGIPQGLRFDVLRRDNFTCRYCGRSSPAVTLHVDHVKPRAKGGEDAEDNLITSCADCNFGKRTKTVSIEKPLSATDGLVGFWGHELIDGAIEYQFRVIRRVNADLYMVQFYSFLFGDPTNIESRTTEFLLGSNCKLYAEYSVWREVMDRQIERDAEMWRAQRAN